jgi:protein-S-isoprenylcysteine O-methyltransferase Ste14
MQIALNNLKRLEFEARIFVSFGIVSGVCALSFLVGSDSRPTFVQLLNAFDLLERTALTLGYSCIAVAMLFVSILRMWAGSVLTPVRVMAFKVQADALKTSGPYRIVRNPIYLADFIAMCAFAVCLPPIGLLMPALFFIHYQRLILFEEESLRKQFEASFNEYLADTPRMIPSFKSLRRLCQAKQEFRITMAGFRHNALFILFVAGYVVAACTHQFVHAVVIGLPAVIDWAIIHTKLGLRT